MPLVAFHPDIAGELRFEQADFGTSLSGIGASPHEVAAVLRVGGFGFREGKEVRNGTVRPLPFECFRRIDGEARAHYNLARMLRHMKQDDLCWQQLQLAVQKDPKLQEARTLLAQMDADRASSVVRVRFEEQPQQQP